METGGGDGKMSPRESNNNNNSSGGTGTNGADAKPALPADPAAFAALAAAAAAGGFPPGFPPVTSSARDGLISQFGLDFVKHFLIFWVIL